MIRALASVPREPPPGQLIRRSRSRESRSGRGAKPGVGGTGTAGPVAEAGKVVRTDRVRPDPAGGRLRAVAVAAAADEEPEPGGDLTQLPRARRAAPGPPG